MKNNDFESALKWANNYIDSFIKNVEFDPFQIITGETDKQHAHYINCVEFLQAIEAAAETFRKNRDNITFTS